MSKSNIYIALLRGVNVGGNNKVSMAELKAEFTRFGYSQVATYINSGNIVFTSDVDDAMKIKSDCERIILDHFKLKIDVAVVPGQDLMRALAHAPDWWDCETGTDAKHNAIFVLPPTTVEEVYEAVGSFKPEYENVAHFERVIFWSAPISTFSKTRWSKVVGSKVYGQITIRNANTTKKLLQMIRAMGI